jgi:AmiR/NasT family two-component response regulator
MSPSLHVVVADDDPKSRRCLEQVLKSLGHRVDSVSDGVELVDMCRSQPVDLVIADIWMPRLDGLRAAEEICHHRAFPIIIISGYQPPEGVDQACLLPVFGYLVKPIKEADVAPAIAVARARFQELHNASRETENLRQALCDRKTIERAKGVLMRESALDEESAFRHLQKVARSKSKKLVEIAQTILMAEEIVKSVPHSKVANA